MHSKSIAAVLVTFALWAGSVFARDLPCESAFAGPVPRFAQNESYTCGVACVRSLIRLFNGYDLGEYYLAQALQAHRYGCTYSGDMCAVLARHGLETKTEMFRSISDLIAYMNAGEKLIVNYRPSGLPHYAVVTAINNGMIYLMDPWVAREDRDMVMSLREFSRVWYSVIDGKEIIPATVIRVQKPRAL